MVNDDKPSLLTRFWHEPVRAECLAAVRIFMALALLGDQLLQYAPRLADLFGPEGFGLGIDDAYLLSLWRWPNLFFHTHDLTVLWACFAAWVAAVVGLLVGWQTRLMSVAVWLLSYCFFHRNPYTLNGGDDLALGVLFLLMFMPTGQALSVDRWLELRRRRLAGLPPDGLHPPMVAPWGLRLLQIQLCMVYLTTGAAKMGGLTWWMGTSVHYVLNDVTMARISFAQLPGWPWLYALASWAAVLWEVSFTPLVCFRRTRPWALWFGVLFHLGIYATIEVGWFSFYTLALYGAFVPGEFWDWLLGTAGTAPCQGAFRPTDFTTDQEGFHHITSPLPRGIDTEDTEKAQRRTEERENKKR